MVRYILCERREGNVLGRAVGCGIDLLFVVASAAKQSRAGALTLWIAAGLRPSQ